MGGDELASLTSRERQVVLAASAGADTKTLAAQLFLSPRTVEHHLSAAYRKLGVPGRAALVALLRDLDDSPAPETRYATNGDVHLAYQVVGEGDQDLVLIPGFVSNVETAWTWPAHARFLRRLAQGRRLIVFDKRGTGLSDPVREPGATTLESRMEDARAVMDAAGSRRPVLFGFSEGAAMGLLFAATYPWRTAGLVLYGALISPALDPSVDPFATPAAAWPLVQELWGTGRFLSPFAPSVAADPAEVAHIARFERHGASPAAAFATFCMASEVELRSLCPVISVPTLVVHRGDDPLVPVAHGRYLADHLPSTRYVEIEGSDHPPWIGDHEVLMTEVDRFTASVSSAPPSPPSRVLQGLLCLDRRLEPALLAEVERRGGRPVSCADLATLCLFDGAVRAADCALALVARDFPGRVLVHAGEVELQFGRAGGRAVTLAGRALAAAPAGEVATTSIVRDLAVGSPLSFVARSGPDDGTTAPFVVTAGASDAFTPEDR